MEQISWTDRVENEEVLKGSKMRGIPYKQQNKKGELDWRIGDIVSKSCLLKHVIEGKIQGRIK
jgi:hypothetical protein